MNKDRNGQFRAMITLLWSEYVQEKTILAPFGGGSEWS